jgi:cobalamin biosynthesis protein CobD/CbiB
MAAMAGALALVLEKPGQYRLGDRPGARWPGAGDIPRSVRIALAASVLATLTAAALGVAIGG